MSKTKTSKKSKITVMGKLTTISHLRLKYKISDTIKYLIHFVSIISQNINTYIFLKMG